MGIPQQKKSNQKNYSIEKVMSCSYVYKIEHYCSSSPLNLFSGGTEAKPYEFPYQGLVGYGKRSSLKWHCGCTLVSPRFVLTGIKLCLISLIKIILKIF
jgi:hypothetical protein